MIYECSDLNMVLSFCTKKTVLILDIDNTLITYKDGWDPNKFFSTHPYITSPENYTSHGHYKHHYNPLVVELVNNYNRDIAIYRPHLTQDNVPRLFREWNKRCAGVIGLTSRGTEVRRVTEKALLGLDINFPRSDRMFRLDSSQQHERTGASFSKNILFCGGQCKGKILKNRIYKGICLGNSIVMVDDSLENLKRVKSVLHPRYNPFIGLHYTRYN